MMSMRAAIMSNPALAETVRQQEVAREAAQRQRAIRLAKYERDTRIVALIKARRHKKASRHLLAQVLDLVAYLRALGATV